MSLLFIRVLYFLWLAAAKMSKTPKKKSDALKELATWMKCRRCSVLHSTEDETKHRVICKEGQQNDIVQDSNPGGRRGHSVVCMNRLTAPIHLMCGKRHFGKPWDDLTSLFRRHTCSDGCLWTWLRLEKDLLFNVNIDVVYQNLYLAPLNWIEGIMEKFCADANW